MKKLIYLIFVISIISGCNGNFLSPQQNDVVYNGNYWKSAGDAQKAVNGTYALFRGLMVNAQMYNRGDVTTGYFNKGWNGGSSDQFYLPGNFDDATSNQKSWGAIQSYADWSGYYKVVAQVNSVIYHINKMPDKQFSDGQKSSLLGQAYFLRALTYYDIAKIWGNAPLTLNPIESSKQVLNTATNTLITLPRSTDVQIMEAVLADTKKAVDLLQFGGPAIMANKGSAQTLAGYANLWMAFLKKRDGKSYNSYYAAAVKALEDVVQNGGYSLASYSSNSDIQNIYKGSSPEAVFYLNISVDQGESYRVDNGGIQFLTCKVPPLNGDPTQDRASSINWVPHSVKKLIYPEYPNDKRADLFFEAWASTYNEPFSDVSPTATNRDSVTWMTKFASFQEDPNHQPNEFTAYFANSDIPVFRYTGVKLLLAETYVKNNESGKALPIINEIRARAGLGNYSGSDILNEVLQEETSELIGEGKLFFAYIRNDYIQNIPEMTPNRYAEKGYYWPVSSNILTENKKIKQTPYWQGKTNW